MRILNLTSSYPRYPGDPSGQFVAHAVDLLRSAGHQVEVRQVCLRGQGPVLRELGQRPWRAWSLAGRSWRALDDAHNFDRVLCHWAWPFPQIAVARSLAPERLRVWCHGSGLRLLHGAGLEALMPQAPTAIVAEHQRSLLPAALRQAVVVPAPLTGSLAELPGTIRPTLVYVGRLVPEKGVDLLPRILDHLPGWRAQVIGWGPLAVPLAKHPRVEMLGPLPNQHWPAKVAKGIGLIPSRIAEGAPLVLREFSALGLPVLCRRVSGLVDPVRRRGLGALVVGDEPKTWAEAAEALLNCSGTGAPFPDSADDLLQFVVGST